MFVSYRDPSVRLTGRWDVTDERYAEATTTGAYIEFAFEGKMAVACFDIEGNRAPFLHLWIQLDGGAMIEAPIDAYLRVIAKDEGRHICRIIFKGTEEKYRRWYRPLHGKVSFRGVSTEKPVAIEADNRRIIEFVGDSITEGVLIDADYCGDAEEQYEEDDLNRIYQDDACATYAWLTAEALDLRPICMGYGAVGATKSGCGGVPRVADAYPYCFEGAPVTYPHPDYVFINHGTNDGRADSVTFAAGYVALLDAIITAHPRTKVIAMSPFNGAHEEDIEKLVAEYNERHGKDILFINGSHWLPKEPVHPLRDGHRLAAEKLAEILQNKL